MIGEIAEKAEQLAQAYYEASLDCDTPLKISRSNRQYKFFEKLAQKLGSDDDPYTFFKVMFALGYKWPVEMLQAFSQYEVWKAENPFKVIIKPKRIQLIEDVKYWERQFRNSGKDFIEFVKENLSKVDPYWVALHEKEFERLKSEINYGLYNKVKKARIWLRKRGKWYKLLKELVNGSSI